MTVVLIGPPASGKSRVGKRVAARLGLNFIDTDALIVRQHGPIAEIFARHGESQFRKWEADAVADALARGGVASLGGGAVTHSDTRRALGAHTVILLTVSSEAVAERLTAGERPLVTTLDEWGRLVAARMPVYESLADYTIDTSRVPMTRVAETVADWLQNSQARPEQGGVHSD